MQIFGLNFSSAPSGSKPITCVRCHERGDALYLDLLTSLSSFEMLQNFLHSDGPWIAGIDFPFGQPRPMVEAMGWPLTWEGYVEAVAAMQESEFRGALESYWANGASIQHEQLRTTDRLAAVECRSSNGIGAGERFFFGAPRLLGIDVCVLPCRETSADRLLVEASPALVAHKVIGSSAYKSDSPGGDASLAQARGALLEGLEAEDFRNEYGFSVSIQEAVLAEIVADHRADTLDALLASVQAAWAWTQRKDNYGIPHGADRLEGWVADPFLKALAAGDTQSSACSKSGTSLNKSPTNP